MKTKNHWGNILLWYLNYFFFLRKFLNFSFHVCAISRKLSQGKEESSNKDLLLYRGTLSWSMVTWIYWQVNGWKQLKMQALQCNATSSYIALLSPGQCSSSLMWQTFDHSIHIPNENASFSFIHSCPDWKDKTVILSGWIADKHTFGKPEWFACFCVTSSHQPIQKNFIPGSRDPVLICKSRQS